MLSSIFHHSNTTALKKRLFFHKILFYFQLFHARLCFLGVLYRWMLYPYFAIVESSLIVSTITHKAFFIFRAF